MRVVLSFAIFALATAVLPVHASDPTPEIQRPPGQPQAVNVVHTLRQIPEACARLEGMYTGNAADPYQFAMVRTSATCQPRARFVDFAKAAPAESSGWKLNDRIEVPSAACSSQKAVIHIWRKPAAAAPPELDAQGRSRLYLKEMQTAAEKGQLNAVPQFAAQMTLTGEACGG